MCVFDYGDALLIFETRGLPRGKAFREKGWSQNMDTYRGERIGQVIECEGGYSNGHVAYDSEGKVIKRFTGQGQNKGDHFENFIKAVRSRKREDQNAEIQEGHLSSALCHLGNISHRVGRQADPDELQAALKNDTATQETLARMEEHLAANGVDLKQTQLTIGPKLKLDPKTERFVDHAPANELLTRPYRAPFVVPAQV